MRYLFVHQNCPGQYAHLVKHLAAQAGNEVIFLTQRRNVHLPGVRVVVYQPARPVHREAHHYLRGVEAGVLNAQAVARVALKLRKEGFIPDLMVGHNGWGEIWYLKEVFPKTPLLGYFEYFYQLRGGDVDFDPAHKLTADTGPRIRTKNLGNLLGLDAVDLGQCPTQWQKSRYPVPYHAKLEVVHEGIDTDIVIPDPKATLELPAQGLKLAAGEEIVTYVARNLEPYRGFPSFMRSLPAILAARPKAQIVIVGGDGVSYGAPRADGKNFRQAMLEELGDSLDGQRVHFLGKVPYPHFVRLLQVSAAHVYLTYPFVLSWSMLEAMSAACLIVASRTAPVEEVIRDGENGILVDFFSPEEIADRVIAALANPEEGHPLRRAARQTAMQYDLKRVCLPGQLRLLDQALGRTSATH